MSDYTEQDPDGRTIDHLVTEDFVFAYWLDHATCSVLITEIGDAR